MCQASNKCCSKIIAHYRKLDEAPLKRRLTLISPFVGIFLSLAGYYFTLAKTTDLSVSLKIGIELKLLKIKRHFRNSIVLRTSISYISYSILFHRSVNLVLSLLWPSRS